MSLFKRPSWAQKNNSAKSETPDPTAITTTATAAATATNPAPANLFSRSENFDNVVAERERKKREKADRKKVKDEKKVVAGNRRSLSDIQLDDDDDDDDDNDNDNDSTSEAKPGKRRRISNRDKEDGRDTAGLVSRRGGGGGGGRSGRKASPVAAAAAALEDEEQISRRYNRIPAPAKPIATRATRRTEPAVIELDSGDEDSGDDLGRVPSPTQPSFESPPPPRQTVAQAYNQPQEDDSESDPELAQIRRTVRENARRQEAEAERLNASTRRSVGGLDHAGTYSPAPPHDPKIQILVTSPIPNTTPLIVSRKLSQRLQEVKDAWFSRQVLEIPKQSIFFTFRLRKLYDVTTGKSLGIKVDDAGKIIPDDRSYLDEDETSIGGQHEGKVHLEAMTEDLLRKMKEERRNGRTGSSAMHTKPGTEGLGGEGTPMADGEAEENVLKINLKAKGFKDIKLKIKPSTTFSRINSAARRMFEEQNKAPISGNITLAFDGEPLEPEDGQIKDTEIENMDSIEVWIK